MAMYEPSCVGVKAPFHNPAVEPLKFTRSKVTLSMKVLPEQAPRLEADFTASEPRISQFVIE